MEPPVAQRALVGATTNSCLAANTSLNRKVKGQDSALLGASTRSTPKTILSVRIVPFVHEQHQAIREGFY